MLQTYVAWWIYIYVYHCISLRSMIVFIDYYHWIVITVTIDTSIYLIANPLSWAPTLPLKNTSPVILFISILTCMNAHVRKPGHICDKLDMKDKEDTYLLCWLSLPSLWKVSTIAFLHHVVDYFSFNLWLDPGSITSNLTQHNYHFPFRKKNSYIGFWPLPPPSALADASLLSVTCSTFGFCSRAASSAATASSTLAF